MDSNLLLPSTMALPDSAQLKLLARATLCFFLLASVFEDHCSGQEPQLIVAPIPKLEALEEAHPSAPFSGDAAFAPETHPFATAVRRAARTQQTGRSRFEFDRAVLTLGLVQGASELFDGATTRYFLHHCSTCTEVDPVSHFLLGSRPAWAGMIAAGSVEALAATFLNEGMRNSRHKFVRRCAPLVPLLLTGTHLVEGSRNLSLKNEFYCTTPGYIVAGVHCVLPSSASTGIAGISLPGLSPNPARISLLHFK
jgi:hypothetical protein